MSEREYTYRCWCGRTHLVGDCHEKAIGIGGAKRSRCRDETSRTGTTCACPHYDALECASIREGGSIFKHGKAYCALLTAREDDNTCAALLSKRDLEDMIAALYGFEDMGHSAPRKSRCKELADSMSQLLREAFPPNTRVSEPGDTKA